MKNIEALMPHRDPFSGWPADTVKFAEKNGKAVLVIDPKEESERWILSGKGTDYKSVMSTVTAFLTHGTDLSLETRFRCRWMAGIAS